MDALELLIDRQGLFVGGPERLLVCFELAKASRRRGAGCFGRDEEGQQRGAVGVVKSSEFCLLDISLEIDVEIAATHDVHFRKGRNGGDLGNGEDTATGPNCGGVARLSGATEQNAPRMGRLEPCGLDGFDLTFINFNRDGSLQERDGENNSVTFFRFEQDPFDAAEGAEDDADALSDGEVWSSLKRQAGADRLLQGKDFPIIDRH